MRQWTHQDKLLMSDTDYFDQTVDVSTVILVGGCIVVISIYVEIQVD